MRGAGDCELELRGVMGEEEGVASASASASERAMRRRRGRRRWGRAEAGDSYSTSSGSGSFGCDSPLAGFVRADGDMDTDLETDGLAATSSSSASAAFTEPHDDEEEAQCGVKGEWQEPAKSPAGGATAIRGTRFRSLRRTRWCEVSQSCMLVCCSTECQSQRRCRTEAAYLHGRKGLKQRPASLDFGSAGFNSGTPFSPGFVVGGAGFVSKGLVSSQISSGVFPSPGTPSYPRRHRPSALGYQKGWSSERVPLPSKGNNTRRYPGSSMAFPLNNRRTLPSKWEDAERWIFSPKSNSGDAREKTATLPHARRPKAKSGPLGPPGRLGGQYSSVSSSVSLFDSGRVGHLAANSPFLAGVLIPEHYGGAKSNVGRYTSGTAGTEFGIGIVGRSSLADIGSPATQSTTVRRRLDTAVESSASLPSTQESVQDEEAEFVEDSAPIITPITSRKDTATQTSPDLSRSSSPSARPSFVRSFSMQQAKERESCFSDLEIRDVQMDERVSLTRWSKKHVTQGSNKNSTNMLEWNKKTVDSKSSSWESSETKCTLKVEREEAKLTAWENLQKAKAEAAIQKLVMKLEKKRSFSLDRILNTLRSAQRKAQGMRDAATASQDEHLCRKAKKTSHVTKNGQIRSLSGCFTCHAF
ncbi:uncharacterized protein LOC119310026 isoform X1 [Triticum dicoccoides]|uniref:uncharacterized protein LOC119310026 isoform X1 n=1 Tax=Triticum dicoccoides TaxID=85692 RepID=UPI001890E40E|nr:uncharacterized protein LOC119310026 isoform X1 [Triticum dicoccoides]XP_037441791.1 uncharacterized protein LOC119310026 isoform X1 [Triticum dicoccoides]